MGTSEEVGKKALDTIVIGAGLAGLTAALRCIQAGQRTLLLAKGMGSLSWTHGAIDVWPADDPSNILTDLPDNHPYHLVGQASLEAALTWLVEITAQHHYRYIGSLNQSVEVCTAIGTWNTVSLFPLTMLAARKSQLATRSVIVAGLRELRDFFPPLLAARLQAQGIDARPSYLTMPPTQRVHEFTPIHLARLFEQPEFRSHIAKQLRSLRGSAQTILVPAVLGLTESVQILSELQTTAGVLIGEVPTLPTVIPGLRLERLLCQAFEQAGGEILINAEVHRGDWHGQQLQAVWTKAAARELRHTADHFILATGGIAGGGLRADYPHTLTETALNLYVQQPTNRELWFSDNAQAPQAVYAAGIPVNHGLQPLDRDGNVATTNLYIAGAAIAGHDLVRQRCINGVALATGWAAAGHVI